MMSKERELLKTILAYMCAEYLVITEFEMITQIEDTVKEIQELLAQPEQSEQEQEPVGYLYKQMDCTGEWATIFKVDKPYITWHDIKDIVPVYTAPPKREPLTPQQISEGNQSMLNVTREAFKQGVIFAEVMHGIGGGE